MNKINWLVRIKNKAFWMAIIPAVLLLVSQILKIFGIDFDNGTWSATILAIVETIFVILAILGIVNDPTTEGMPDSIQAQGYEEPKSLDEQLEEVKVKEN